jgi:phage tail sheath protein FI
MVMPEYLAPGVYVEEVSFRPKSIEGLSTSVAGFIGPTRYGPVGGTPELLTSFSDYERIYGGLDQLRLDNADQDNYLAHAVRAFFDQGGTKLYVTRLYESTHADDDNTGKASLDLPRLASPPALTLRARFPGRGGEQRITFVLKASPNPLFTSNNGTVQHVAGLREGDAVYIDRIDSSPNAGADPGVYDVVPQGDALVFSGGGGTVTVDELDMEVNHVYKLTVGVRVKRPGRFENELVWSDLSPSPGSPTGLLATFTAEPSGREYFLTIPFAFDVPASQPILSAAALLDALLDTDAIDPRRGDLAAVYTLAGGSDGRLPTANTYQGDDGGQVKTGLTTFEDMDEISIVAAPGASANYVGDNQTRIRGIVQNLITHCEIRMRYRVAVFDAPNNQILSEVRDFRGRFDSTHAALYYPWIKIADPLDPSGRRELLVPPSGFVAGIYARTDVLHGVFKAPANEVVLGAVGLETIINKSQQDVLNPIGINCFRYFENRGFRLWGARTISSDPDWRYISVRRYFAYLEHSIDKGTQWAVFENNNEALWKKVRDTVSNFLVNEWRNGALLGTSIDEAFFVRCDRSTMTQLDLDVGRLICLIGVAVVKPAEYVIFRIGQFTADKKS